MKLKRAIKKIAALGCGVAMVGSTIMGAMALDLADYPSPFISGGKFAGVMAVGDNAKAEDVIGVTDIATSLQYVTSGGDAGTGISTSVVGEAYKIEKSADKFNIGDEIDNIKSKIDKDELPTILADGELRNKEGKEFEYEQEITIADGHQLTHFADKDYKDEEPTIGIKLDKSDIVLLYELDFKTNAESSVDANDDMDDWEDREIQMLGETYDIIGSDNSTAELELMKGATKDTLEEGETKTYTIDGVEYEVNVPIITDTGTQYVKFVVNGETTDALQDGETYKLSNGVQVGIREILPNEAGDVSQDMVTFYLGAKKVKLTNGQELEMDEDDVDNVDAYVNLTRAGVTADETALEQIGIMWTADDDLFIAPGEEVVMPGLEAIKFSMDSFYMGKEEVVEIMPSGKDTIKLKAPLAEYDVDLDILFDVGNDGTWNVNGGAANKELIINNTANSFLVDTDTDEYFVVTRIDGEDAETHVLEVSRIDDTDGVNVKDYAGNLVASKKSALDTFDVGDIELRIDAFDEGTNWVNFTMISGNGVSNTIVTKEGLQIKLPYNMTNNTGSYWVNASQGAGTALVGAGAANAVPQVEIVIQGEDKDENIAAGAQNVQIVASFTAANEATLSIPNANETGYNGGDVFEIGNTDDYVGITNESVSIKVETDTGGDQDSVKVTYPGEETYANIYIASQATVIESSGSAGGESVEVSKIEVGAN